MLTNRMVIHPTQVETKLTKTGRLLQVCDIPQCRLSPEAARAAIKVAEAVSKVSIPLPERRQIAKVLARINESTKRGVPTVSPPGALDGLIRHLRQNYHYGQRDSPELGSPSQQAKSRYRDSGVGAQ